MHKRRKNGGLTLFTYIELIFAFAVNTLVLAVNLGYQNGAIGDYVIANAFLFLVMFVSALGVAGIQLIQIYRKKSEIGLRRAVGACDKDIFLLIIKDTLLIILIPAIIGSITGTILAKILPVNTLGIEAQLDYKLIFLCIFAIIIFTFLSGLFPAIKAVNINLLDALRKNNHVERKTHRRIFTFGFYVITITVILAGYLINHRLETEYRQDIMNTTGSPPAMSEEVPKFSYRDADGNVISSEALKGKGYIVVVYEVSCPVTPSVFDYLKKLSENGVIDTDNIVAVCVDKPMEDVKLYLNEHNLSIHPLVDIEKETKWAFKANMVPAVYIVDKDGIIRIRALGWSDELQQYVDKELMEYIW